MHQTQIILQNSQATNPDTQEKHVATFLAGVLVVSLGENAIYKKDKLKIQREKRMVCKMGLQ